MPDPRGPRGYVATSADDPFYRANWPEYYRAQEGHKVNSPTIAVTLNVPREQIITELTTRRDEIAAAFDVKIQAGRDLVATFGAPLNERFADLYQRLSDGLRSGTYVVSESYHRVQLASDGQRPSRWVDQLPQAPNKPVIERAVAAAEKAKTDALQGIDDTLRLLNMSDDETVSVQGEQYQRALSANVDIPDLDRWLNEGGA